MKRFCLPLVSTLILLVGCSQPQDAPHLTTDHPASIDAAETPYAPPANVLVMESRAEAAVPVAPSGHQGHTGHGQAAASASTPTSAPATRPDDQTSNFTCPMHAEVVQSGPGKCPKCGMTLKKKASHESHSEKGAQ